jgi:hypothetical protein
MKVTALMVVNAIVAGLFGIGFVLVPDLLLSQYGITTDAPFELVGQLFGAALIGFAALTWTARNATDSDAGRAILLALFVADAIGFAVALIGQLGGIVNALGWSTVVIYLVLALGFGYFRFAKQAVA